MTQRASWSRRAVLGAGLALAAGRGAWAQDEPLECGTRARKRLVGTDEYATREVEGWTVRVNRRLNKELKALGEPALRLLGVKLYDITRVVPATALRSLQKVPIWLGVEDGHAPCAEYHPSREWLTKNGYNPDKARAVELGNAARFLEWSLDQPWMVLHELAHAYHDQVLGYEHAEVRAAFQQAKDGGSYESILRAGGKMERAYALNNDQEYFAELSEAFFGVNDFFPFVRTELARHDAEGYRTVAKAWGVDIPASS
jgi:hypothetical protein